MKRQVEDSLHIILSGHCDEIYHFTPLRRKLILVRARSQHQYLRAQTRYITNTVYLDGNASRVADTLARIWKTPDGLSETLQYRSIGK